MLLLLYWQLGSLGVLNVLTFSDIAIIAGPEGSFIAPHVWEIVGRKNLTIFKEELIMK